MTAEMIAPEWMHEQITAEQYDSWPEAQCRDIEIIDGAILTAPSPSKWHNRVGTALATALHAGGRPDWRAGTDFDVRFSDAPLINLRPDVIVYRADTIDVTPTRPEHVLLLVEIVSPGSETSDRKYKPLQYAEAGIEFYWRVEDATTRLPVVFTYRLDPAGRAYRATEAFNGVVRTSVPFAVEIDLTAL